MLLLLPEETPHLVHHPELGYDVLFTLFHMSTMTDLSIMCLAMQVCLGSLSFSGAAPSIFMKMRGKLPYFFLSRFEREPYEGIVLTYLSCHRPSCWETRTHAWIWWILRVPVLLTISVKIFIHSQKKL